MTEPGYEPRLAGQVALITGAGHGIGRATALRLAAEGAHVVAADVDIDAARRVADIIAGHRRDALAVACDVLDPVSVEAAVGAAVDRFGGLDTLVCVAGGARPVPEFIRTSDEDWSDLLDLNLTSVVRCCRAALPVLSRPDLDRPDLDRPDLDRPDLDRPDLDRPGRRQPSIVVVGSVNGLLPFGDETYSAAKAALVSLVTNLAADWGPAGVRVNLVAPGTIRTRVWDTQPGGADRLRSLYPLGRVGEPEDIAAAIAFLASADADWITGVTLPVDGGLSVGSYRRLLAKLPAE